MFESHQTIVGTQYTTTVALLVVALVFCPLMLLVGWPVGVLSAALTLLCSMACVVLAWVSWKFNSKLTMTTVNKAGVS